MSLYQLARLLLLLTAVLRISASSDSDFYSWKTASISGDTVEIVVGINASTLLRYAIVKIDRKLCHPFYRYNISMSAVTTDILHSRVGADEIIFSIEGPSIQMLILQPAECNTYSKSFSIPIAGNYRVKAVHMRSNYSAVNEMEDRYPEITYDLLLDTPLYLNKTESSSPICDGHWIHKTPDQSLLQNMTYHLEPPAFGRSLPITTYTSISSNPKKNVIGNQTFSCAENANNYNWILSDCPDPIAQLINSSDAAQLLAGRRINFIGDSHVRTFTNNILRWACNEKFPQVRSRSTGFTVPLTSALCPGLHISYFVEYFCQIESLPPLDRFDLVIANCGHHPAAERHYTLVEYREAVTKLADKAILKGFTPSTFAWLESVPQPQRFDKFVVDYKDWRTYHRLDLFNKYANEIMQRPLNETVNGALNGSSNRTTDGNTTDSALGTANGSGSGSVKHSGFSVISSFTSLMPFSDKFCDNAHYSSHDSSVPQYQELLRLLMKHR